MLQGAAAAAAAYFIRSTEVFQFDLLDSPAVAQLDGDSQHATTYQLLSLLLAGDVQVGLFNTNPGTDLYTLFRDPDA